MLTLTYRILSGAQGHCEFQKTIPEKTLDTFPRLSLKEYSFYLYFDPKRPKSLGNGKI